MEEMVMVERGFRLKGRVQGVGFRWWTRKTAQELGVVGTVRNLPDGSVEVMARAEEPVMDHFADKLRQGPSVARVTEVEWLAPKLSPSVDRFTIEHA
jgi:acylphosphatase